MVRLFLSETEACDDGVQGLTEEAGVHKFGRQAGREEGAEAAVQADRAWNDQLDKVRSR